MGDKITVERTGDRPLAFAGELLAQASSRMNDANRWHELALYKVAGDDGRYVLSVGYRTQWQGELDHDMAIICVSPEDVAEQLRMTLPDEHVVGYPIGNQYAEKQARMKNDLEMRFKNAVTEILQELGPEEI